MKRIFCSGPLPLPWIFCLAYFFVSSRKSTGSLDPVKLGGGGGGGSSAGNNRGGGPTPGKETKLLVLCVIFTTTFTINRYSTDNDLFPVPTHLAL